jgi:hypothetical protein
MCRLLTTAATAVQDRQNGQQNVEHAHRFMAICFAEVVPQEMARPLHIWIPTVVALETRILVEMIALQTNSPSDTCKLVGVTVTQQAILIPAHPVEAPMHRAAVLKVYELHSGSSIRLLQPLIILSQVHCHGQRAIEIPEIREAS